LEEADSECVKDKNALLTFVVVGGGFGGVERVAGINDLYARFCRPMPDSFVHAARAGLWPLK
jgi:NADH dehydrogenase FAD-containing subunit